MYLRGFSISLCIIHLLITDEKCWKLWTLLLKNCINNLINCDRKLDASESEKLNYHGLKVHVHMWKFVLWLNVIKCTCMSTHRWHIHSAPLHQIHDCLNTALSMLGYCFGQRRSHLKVSGVSYRNTELGHMGWFLCTIYQSQNAAL